MNDVAQRILSILTARFKTKGAAAFNLNQELNMPDPVTERNMSNEEKEYVKNELLKIIQYKESHDGTILIPVSVVSEPRGHEEWYDDWLAANNDTIRSYYWKSLENFLSLELTRKYSPIEAGKIVKSIDDATYCIMKKLASPSRKEFNYKGLVVGYIQSGKTANFTALIAKAADAGYKMIIVLSGIHSILRRQTQIRLDKELTGMNDMRINESFIPEPPDIKKWKRTTTAIVKSNKTRQGEVKIKDMGEFDLKNLDPFSSLCNRSTPTIAIIKKNVSVLNKLIEYISVSTEENRANMPVLIIDDEADQASIDGNANDPESNPTSTNDRIRRILNFFPRKAYVGYTATPFANVLINMDTEHNKLSYDFYPRNFIISLPEPDDYFGTSKIFQSQLSTHIVKPTNDTEGDLLQNGITNDLVTAIECFIIGCAVRNKRGDKSKPMSMLVHVSRLTHIHSAINEYVSNYVDTIKRRYNSEVHNALLKEQFAISWKVFKEDAEKINQGLKKGNLIPDFENVWNEVGKVFKVLKVLELNASSDDKLDYTTGQEIKVIAIGGNQLSRGLTLEGLMTSYYLRQSNQYDTLLQMGRWFGYRHGYEDLTKIFTTSQIWEYFSHLAVVEEELRRDIRRYDDTDNTPADLALTIRTHSRLAVTAPNKLGAAQLRQTSYSDSLNQTFRFPLDHPEKLRANLNIGDSFIKTAMGQSKFKESWVKGVYVSEKTFSSEFIIDSFFDRYNFEERFSGPGLEINDLRGYIFRNRHELKNWKIALAGNAQINNPVSLGGISFNMINRSRISNNIGYDCGVITDKKHLLSDLHEGATSRSDGRNSEQGLLILYIINKDSKGEKEGRIDLFYDIASEKINVLGFAMILPESRNEPYNRIGQ